MDQQTIKTIDNAIRHLRFRVETDQVDTDAIGLLKALLPVVHHGEYPW